MAICSNCGKENPEGFAFCGFCSAPIAEQPIATIVEERKVVSVLFCDLVGFTATSERQDPEDVRARIRPYHARLRSEIEGYGGTVEKFVGDAVMAVFGAPAAHEDDAERAVRAGLAVLEAIAELNEDDPELELQVRVGINTGEAVVALGARPEQGEGFVTGDVVNTAARIQSAAPVGGVAVGEQTYRATSRVFEYEPLEPVSVKGKSEPLSLWQARAAHSRFGTDITRRYTTPLVGRELEKPLLIGTFERAAQQRSVQLVTVVGEPGVGKSRLVAELFAYLKTKPELTRWRQGRCLPYGEGITFWALGEIVKAEAGILESDSAEVAAAKLDAAVSPEERGAAVVAAASLPAGRGGGGLAGGAAGAVHGLAALLGGVGRGPAECARVRGSALGGRGSVGVPGASGRVGAGGAAASSLHGAAGAVRATPGLGLWAAQLSHDQPAAALGSGDGRARFAPDHDQRARARSWSSACWSGRAATRSYAEEFVRLLADRDLGADETELPESLQALIAARLDTLSPERKSLLQDAAVLGKVFWVGALAEIGGHDLDELELALHELARKELVRPARLSSMEGESEYSFWHLLVRDVAYAQIPRAERARRHRSAAAWIERKAGERVEDLAELLAYHYLQALELAEAAGDTEASRQSSPRLLAAFSRSPASGRSASIPPRRSHGSPARSNSAQPTTRNGRSSSSSGQKRLRRPDNHERPRLRWTRRSPPSAHAATEKPKRGR